MHASFRVVADREDRPTFYAELMQEEARALDVEIEQDHGWGLLANPEDRLAGGLREDGGKTSILKSFCDDCRVAGDHK